jgi:CRISPR-associated protein Cmr2
MSSRWLFRMAFGPVQGFIAAARKTRDLKSGSEMLVELGRVLARAVKAHDPKTEWIFPADPEKWGPNIMQFAAVVENPEQLAADCKALAASEFDTWFERWVAVPKGGEDIRRVALSQFQAYFEFFAVWEPFDESDSYTEVQHRLGERFRARKALRSFPAAPQSVSVPVGGASRGRSQRIALRPKSPLLPELDSALPCLGDGYTLSVDHQKQYGLRPHEHLDGISLLKRQRNKGRAGWSFPSTRQAAISDAVAYAEPEFRELNHLLDGEDFDLGDLLLGYPEEEGYRVSEDIAHKVTVLQRQLKATGYVRRPYYAVLHGDGDGMGELLSRCQRIRDHQDFSRQLSEAFAAKVGVVVERHYGATVYAGGDDVLALLPLSTALSCGLELQELFEKAIQGGTLSMGMAIAHIGENLQHAVERSRRLEAFAKRLPGKSALAIGTLPRSGSETIFRCRWKAREGSSEPDAALLRELQQAFKKEGEASRRFPYKARAEAEMLHALGNVSPHVPRAAYLRLAQKSEVKESILSQPPDWLNTTRDFREFASALIISHFLTRGESV